MSLREPDAGGKVKDLIAKFAEVERRVRRLVDENRVLRSSVRDLERQLSSLRETAGSLEKHREKQSQVRERLKRLLKTLEHVRKEERKEEQNPASAADS